MKHNHLPSAAKTAEVQANTAGRRRGANYYRALALTIVTGISGGLAESAYANPAQAPSTRETPAYEHQPKTASSEATPAEAVRSVEIKKGSFLVNGKQASLNLIYGPAFNAEQADMMVDKLGVNLIADNVLGTTPQELSAKSNGRYWIMPGSRPVEDKGFQADNALSLPSNSIGATWEDEPDGHLHAPGYEANTLKFKGLPNLQTFNQQIAWHNMYGNDSYDLNGQHLTYDDYLKYIKNLDNGIVMMDFYPLVEMTQPDWKSALDLTYQTVRGVNNITRSVNPNNLTGYWQALHNWHPEGKPLTPEVITCEMLVSQAAGANVLGYWADPTKLDQILPETFRRFVK